jgi:hypothetical protein
MFYAYEKCPDNLIASPTEKSWVSSPPIHLIVQELSNVVVSFDLISSILPDILYPWNMTV